MEVKQFTRRLLFLIIYVPFATAALIYLFTGGELGAEVMLEAAFLPWWLSLVALPPLLVLVILVLGILDLGEYV